MHTSLCMETNTSTRTREASPVTPTGCCPPFDPGPWDGREVAFHDRLFVKERVHSVFHVPLDFERAVLRANARIQAAGAAPAQGLMLSDERSAWKSDLYIDVTRPVPGAEMARLSGTFLTKVYDGPFRDAGKWMADMKRHVAGQNRRPEKIFLGYTTCPRCAKAYGHNYVVLLAKVGEKAS
jgi:hypothetical protein